MEILQQTLEEFKEETKKFEKLLFSSEEFSKNFQDIIPGYLVTNAFGTLHFLLTRNVRLIRESQKLALHGYYTEALILTRSVMEGSFLSRYFAVYPMKMKEWHELQEKINIEKDQKKLKKLKQIKLNEYGPDAIRKKLIENNEKLLGDVRNVYFRLCDFTHPPILSEGDFLLKHDDTYTVVSEPYYHKGLFIEWFRASSLALSNSLRMFDIFYRKKIFQKAEKEKLKKLIDLFQNVQSLIKSLPKNDE